MTTRSQIMRRWWLASSVLLVLFVGSVWARTPLSVRVMGGFTGAMERGLAYETDRWSPMLGIGARCTLSPRHSVFLDFEGSRRWSGDASEFNWLIAEPLNRRLSCYSLALGYQFMPLAREVRLSPFLLAGVVRTKYVLNIEGIDYGFLGGGLGEPVDIPSVRHTTYGNGLLAGVGCATGVSSRFSISGALLYRYLHNPSATNTSGRADTQQNQNGIPISRLDSRVHGSFSGLEGKLVLEVRI